MWQGREPELLTDRLKLRAFRMADLPDLHAIDSDPAVTYFRGIEPMTQEESEAWVRRAQKGTPKAGRKHFSWCIRRRQDDAFVGFTLLRSTRLEYQEWEVGYCLAQAQWGQGYATEATRGTLEFAYRQLSAHRVVANVYPQNEPSLKLLRKLGFREEARQLETYFEHGEWQDNVQYALLSREWEQRAD
ncbi:MAG: GNAT family N-acetyltransferase [Chlorobia bacterium]|nr:GNAT family N-acetyltransferase [Fimbriimonadaceae bacterium]